MKVRDSPMVIRSAMDRLMNKHKKTLNENGWPAADFVEKKELPQQPEAKKEVIASEDGLVVIGRSLLPSLASESENQMPEDLRTYSTEEVSRWVIQTLEDRNLAARFVRNGVTGQTLAAIRDNKQDIVGRLNMLGVPSKLRAR